jgi:uncharacterized membrane protein HdeD (DUF308 family)
MSMQPGPEPIDVPQRLWTLFLILGGLLVLLGVVAIVVPFIAGTVTVMIWGWLLLFGGIAHGVAVFQTRTWSGAILHLLMAVLALVVGFLFILEPFEGLVAVTLILAVFFTVGGLFRIVAALMIRTPNQMYHLLAGFIALLLGILIWRRWPESSVWVIGTFVGIELLFEGIVALGLAFALRRLPKA